jgi:hypothetical protein
LYQVLVFPGVRLFGALRPHRENGFGALCCQ